MTCAELEILLCDYMDGTLRSVERTALESHMSGCNSCAELAKDAAGAVGFMERAAVAEPPAELLTRILHETPSARQLDRDRQPWWRKIFGGWFQAILQPRYAMGMAMTILSFSMLARFAGIEPRQLKPSDLDPARIWATVDDRAHRAWDRAMKYYDNLRLVIEIQSRLKEWTDQEQSQKTENGKQKAGSSGQKPEAGTRKCKRGKEHELYESSRCTGHRLLPDVRKGALRHVPAHVGRDHLLRGTCAGRRGFTARRRDRLFALHRGRSAGSDSGLGSFARSGIPAGADSRRGSHLQRPIRQGTDPRGDSRNLDRYREQQ